MSSENRGKDVTEMLYKHSNDESYRRYKYIQYRNLVLKSLLSFILGILFAFFIKLM